MLSVFAPEWIIDTPHRVALTLDLFRGLANVFLDIAENDFKLNEICHRTILLKPLFVLRTSHDGLGSYGQGPQKAAGTAMAPAALRNDFQR